MKYNELTSEEKRVIEEKGTEGTFVCRKCNNPLFSSKAKFDAGCGWPSFDQNFANAVKRIPDRDGQRTEIQCTNCGAHLGHVFLGEHFTEKNTRYCTNSLSIRFIPKDKEMQEVIHE